MQQIIFDNRYKGDQQHDCLLSVDGTDFRINWTSKAFYSHKFKGCGLRYEVALNILTGDICWINGPFEPGKYNDLMIFRMGLMGELDEGERVEADDGYLGEAPLHVKCPKCLTSDPAKKKLKSRVRSRHETCNKRFKQWKILKEVYRHNVADHGSVFRSIAVLTQISFQKGEPLFQVNYHN